ncbi:MAG: GGDEF domain-containing protein [Solirubrobacteraceae bacterium]
MISRATIEEIVDGASERGWPEIVMAGLYLEVIRCRPEGKEAHLEAIARLLKRAEAEGDAVMSALALARRARALTSAADPALSVAAEMDLARASVLIDGALIDGAEGMPSWRARAHINCAIAYGQRDLWELEDQHYRAAEAVLGGKREESRLWRGIVYNRAEFQLDWTCAMRELGETEAVAHHAAVAAEFLRAAQISAMPASWREELRIFAALLGAIAPSVGGPAPEVVPAEGEFAGYVHLARALSAPDAERAAHEAAAAVESIDPDTQSRAHSLALCVAAEIEVASVGSETAGIRYARRLAQRHYAVRLSALASMQSLLSAERLRSEHDLLSKRVFLDDLTRLGNRSALVGYVESLAAQGVSSIALVLLDVDGFKAINDTYGHRVGDEVLIHLAAVLRDGVRNGDLAVRLGGDEFLLVLASMEREAARRRAETILAGISAAPWEQISPGLQLTASLGLAFGRPQELEGLTERADIALYSSKAAGGNRVSESREPPPTERAPQGAGALRDVRAAGLRGL